MVVLETEGSGSIGLRDFFKIEIIGLADGCGGRRKGTLTFLTGRSVAPLNTITWGRIGLKGCLKIFVVPF